MTSRPTEIGTARLSGRRDEERPPETAAAPKTLPEPLTPGQVEDVRKSKGVSKLRADQQSAKGPKNMGSSYDYKLTQQQKLDERGEAVSGGKESARRSVAAEYYHAGVCDDYSYVTFNVLREIANGEKISRVAAGGLHHAFCIIGDLTGTVEQDNELVVADPWPTHPQACTWACSRPGCHGRSLPGTARRGLCLARHSSIASFR